MNRYNEFKRVIVYMVMILFGITFISCNSMRVVKAEGESGKVGDTNVTWQIKNNTLIISGGSLEGFVPEEPEDWPWVHKDFSYNNVSIAGRITGATSLNWMFDNMHFKQIDISNIDMSNVTTVCGMFQDCYALESVELGDFDSSKITNMAAMFNMCRKLERIDLSKFNTSNVKDMSSMFSYCEKLDVSGVKDWDVSGVEDIRW